MNEPDHRVPAAHASTSWASAASACRASPAGTAPRASRVSGCDAVDGPAQAALRADGIPSPVGHDPRHVERDVDVLVTTMAVPRDHPEVLRARELGVAVRPRIGLLGDLFARRQTIGITGTHGKSSTTGMVATLLLAAGVDPSIQLGASLPGLVGNMRHGAGPHLAAEVDESDPGFADLRARSPSSRTSRTTTWPASSTSGATTTPASPTCEAAARRFASERPQVLYCADWPGLDELLGDHPRAVRYGVAPDADDRIEDLALGAAARASRSRCRRRGAPRSS
jgi:UDP-N-acetylmuramate--alanine ligase